MEALQTPRLVKTLSPFQTNKQYQGLLFFFYLAFLVLRYLSQDRLVGQMMPLVPHSLLVMEYWISR